MGTLDVILWASDNSLKRRIMEFLTGETWTHVGIVLEGRHIKEMHKRRNIKDEGIDPDILYIWESGYNGKKDAEDGKIKCGVMITPWKKMSGGRCVVRKFKKEITEDILRKLEIAYEETYKKKYDINPIHLLEALIGREIVTDGQNKESFFCSAFVGYIYTRIGMMKDTTEWSVLQPKYFGSSEVDEFLEPIKSEWRLW